MYAIVVHGGAGQWRAERREAALEGVRRAAVCGLNILTGGGGALDAVVAAVVSMEDDPVFNAGTGSALNLDGEAEMDAGVMVGEDLRTGNVAGLRRVKNPILVARAVMERTDHVLLAGDGALRLARAFGFQDYEPVTSQRRDEWREKRAALVDADNPSLPRLRVLLQDHPDLSPGTVGAVALDTHGVLAAATSTGGITLKLPGRIGDTPVPGAGNYATSHGACSATGLGELMLRYLTARSVCDHLHAGQSAKRAVEAVLTDMRAAVGGEVGMVAIDRNGTIGVGHLTAAMPHAYASASDMQVVAALQVDDARGC